VFVRKQKFVEDSREAIMIGRVGLKGLDSGEGRDTCQHSVGRIKEFEVAKRQEKIFIWKKGFNIDGV
jgi:hypothetical protein